VQYQVSNVRCQFFKLSHFRAAHGDATGRRIVIGTGKMIEAVGDVEREFLVNPAMIRTFLHRPLDIDNQVAGAAFFAGNRFTAETDDICGAVFPEKPAVGLCNSFIVCKKQSDLFPDAVRTGDLKQSS